MIYQQQKPLLGELPDWTRFPRPAALWAMNEGSGSIINDLSGNGNTGTLVGDTHWVGSALSFDGSEDYVLTNKSPVTSMPLTMIVWFNQPVAADEMLVCLAEGPTWGDNDESYAIMCEGTGPKLKLRTEASASYDYTESAVTFTSGGWHMAAGVWVSATERYLYTDGGNPTLDTASKAPGAVNVCTIGRGQTTPWDFTGKIRQAMIFNRALSAAEIAYLYRNPFPWFEEDEVSHLYVPAAAGNAGIMTCNIGYWGPTF